MNRELLPANLDAERMILGSVLLDSDQFSLIADSVSDDDFSIERHSRIWRAMSALYEAGERIDRVTLANRLQGDGLLEAIGGLTYICELDSGMPQVGNLDGYVRIVREKATLRKAALQLNAIAQRLAVGDGESSAILEQAEEIIQRLGSDRSDDGWATPSDVLRESMEAVLDPASRRKTGELVELPWPLRCAKSGFEILDSLEPGKLYVLAARPGMGKTAMAAQIAVHAARNGKATAMFSLEMDCQEIIRRIVAGEAQVNAHKLKIRIADNAERARMNRAAAEVASLPLYLYRRLSATVPSVISQLRRLTARVTVRLVVIDYLQLLDSTGWRQDNRATEISRMTRRLKLATKEFSVPILLLSQLSREHEKENREPHLRDLRESGSIEQDADAVIFLHAPKTEPELFEMKVLVKKHRNGPLGAAALNFIPRFTRFESIGGDQPRDEQGGLYETA